MRRRCRVRAAITLVLVALVALPAPLLAADHAGQVTFAGVAVPGVTVTLARGDTRLTTVTDADGVYRFSGLEEGVWSLLAEMLGFAPLRHEITVPAPAPTPAAELTLLSFDDITRGVEVIRQEPVPAASPQPAVVRGNSPAAAPAPAFQRAGVNPSVAAPPPPAAPAEEPDGNSALGATDGFLVNGSVNNGAASPFAQLAAFGNNRRAGRSLYNGGIGLIAGNSAWDARPHSFTGQNAPKPSYSDLQWAGTFGGPLRIPGLLRNGPQFFVGYQRSADHNAVTQPARLPTALERAGDFSRTLDALGRPVRIVDPATRQPFAGGVIPADRISPQAAALLGLYPQPNIDSATGFNFQAPIVVATESDAVQSRLNRAFRGQREQLLGTLSYQRTTTDSGSLFGFVDQSRVATLNTEATWSHRLSQFLTTRLRYQWTRTTTDVTPHFSGVRNVSADAGIAGNNQDPVNWGPPTLQFATGVAGLNSAQFADNTNQAHGVAGEVLTFRGRHNLTIGGGARRHLYDVFSQQDARGTFSFTGVATGYDLADFMLGVPAASAIAFGNADKYLRSTSIDAFVNDDWRVSPSLTLNLGVRWEYESPVTERFGRLVNLEVAPGFTSAVPVIADDATGSDDGDALLQPDRGGIQPRLGAAWRPVPGSSLVVRAGYGIYRNTNTYSSIALAMAQQPPLSSTGIAEHTTATPLTLANGFATSAALARNTFAVDPRFRVGSAHNWQVSAQRDFPASMTGLVTYLGSRGTGLMQQFLPNTYPAGAANPCASCPAGFVYLTSDGESFRNAGQFQLRRRLRNGFTATAQYTLAKATDNASAYTTSGLNASGIAQNWLDLDAEYGPSSFDQRHLFTLQVQYTTGVGVSGGSLVDGARGALLKDWTFVANLTAGSGLPLTPIVLAPVRGTGITGPLRPSYSGADGDAAPDGYYANPAAFTVPAAGEWGDVGRHSVTGPRQFNLNAGVSRTFRMGERLNLDWRIDATNVLNRVTYSSLDMLVGSPQFGLPNRTNNMRELQSTIRLRF